jgi:DNA-binding NtrC family response regulator
MSSYAAEVSVVDHHVHSEPLGDRLVLRDLLASVEKSLVVVALLAAEGNQKRAAAALGVLPSTLSEKLRRFGLLARRDRAMRREEIATRAVPLTEPRSEASTTTSSLEKEQ